MNTATIMMDTCRVTNTCTLMTRMFMGTVTLMMTITLTSMNTATIMMDTCRDTPIIMTT
ncbi:hypothetical protein D3C73_1389790 [compost metagenome]